MDENRDTDKKLRKMEVEENLIMIDLHMENGWVSKSHRKRFSFVKQTGNPSVVTIVS